MNVYHQLYFVYLNEDGVDPGTNNTPRPPITGKRTARSYHYISINLRIPLLQNMHFSFYLHLNEL